MKVLRGVGGAPGTGLGQIVQLKPAVAAELAPFPTLVTRATMYLRQIGERLRVGGMPAEAEILDAQALLANDPSLLAAVSSHTARGMTISAAIRAAIAELVGPLESLEDAYLRERAADVRAVGAALLAAGAPAPVDLPVAAILVADELTPAEIVTLPREKLAGLATAKGTATSHVAIRARSLGIPAVIGIGPEVLALVTGALAIVDGTAPTLIVEPDDATCQHYERLQARLQEQAAEAVRRSDQPATTCDGRRVLLWANIGAAAEVLSALRAGAEGIGLFRTEFLFLGRKEAPSEQEQCRIYTEVLGRMQGRPVVIRTLDAGGDKTLPYLPNPAEPTPALGERGIRLSRRFPALFRTQLRALLCAAVAGDLRIMLPMVATIADVRWARAELDAMARALRDESLEHRADVPLGIMIETPAAAVMADRLAEAVDFFSIGSNDLTQYTLAVDRALPRMAERYGMHDPAVFRLIAMSVAGARRARIPVAVCGELAGDPTATEALVGIGVDALSMAANALSIVRERVRHTTVPEALAAGRVACDQ